MGRALAGGEPPSLPNAEDMALSLKVRATINGARDAETIVEALETVGAWRGAWLARLANEPGTLG